ncbi:MAG: hypothetical protein R2709_14870 [Marmoricola sp.]
MVWVVPNQRRLEQLTRRLSDEAEIDRRLFTVITLDQLDDLVRLGAVTSRNARVGERGGQPS